MSENEKIKILTNVLGNFYREGQYQLLFYCPKCEHHRKKLSINIEKNVFKCWVCDYSGRNIYRLIRKYGTYSDKKQWSRISQQVEIQDFSDELFSTPEKEIENLDLPEEFVSLVNKKLPTTSIYPMNYLRSRGLTKEDVVRWKVGYCSTGTYENRVIFPSFDLAGKLNYFVARSYIDDWKRYCNPPTKNDIIFNHLYLDFSKPITIVEGVFDAVKSGKNSVPLLGSTLNENSTLLSEIIKNNTTVYLALDSDARKKTEKLIDLLLRYDVELHVIDLQNTQYEDVGEMTKQEFQQLKLQSIRTTVDTFLVDKIINM